MKILILTLYPEPQPSTRFRVWQYLRYIKNAGISYTVSPAVPKNLFSYLYLSKRRSLNRLYTIIEAINRLKDIVSSYKYDAVFIQKAICSSSLRGLDSLLFYFNKNVIYDYDDAVHIMPPSGFFKFFSILQDKDQIKNIIRRSKAVIAGNHYLERYAKTLNSNVFYIPTSVDTERCKSPIKPACPLSKTFTIGWSGTRSTNQYLNILSEPLNRLALNGYRFQLKIVSTDLDYVDLNLFKGYPVEFEKWSYDNEHILLSSFDIGVMPLKQDRWTEGKCGLKLLLYMAYGIPVIGSPVGINSDILEDGINGYLANTNEEWTLKLTALLSDVSIRKQFIENGSQTVNNKYSVNVNATKLTSILRSLHE
ncbi:MAG: glycosyltransferase family 4 protein [Candidatus Ancaeobacter aquaticus]|nr:glycosyltransferase family 4 protein [Candidatus Ancaeobacter aquaticus]